MTAESRPVVIVTGGASGIGRACVDSLAEDGWAVMATDLVASGEVIRCDVTDPDEVAGAIDRVLDEHGRIDGLVNAAGAGWRSDFLSATDELWTRTLDVNLMGTVRACRAALPSIRVSDHPRKGIVNFTSQAAKTLSLIHI